MSTNWKKQEILRLLDSCAKEFTFPVMDNGYSYPAASRLSLYRSDSDWAIVIEIFGFSPRSGEPDVQIFTFSSKLHNRNESTSYVSTEAHKSYLKNNPYNESRFVYPIDNSDWQDPNQPEYLCETGMCILRGIEIPLPKPSEYKESEILLTENTPLTFEFCRFLASRYRHLVLCTEEERRVSVAPEMRLALELDEWHHPDISSGELPGSTQTFQQLANMIATNNFKTSKTSKIFNTHWINWPEAGTL